MTKNQKQQSIEIQSPCVSNCCLDESDVCLGCFRHVDEITGWHSADSSRRLEVLAKCNQRKENR